MRCTGKALLYSMHRTYLSIGTLRENFKRSDCIVKILLILNLQAPFSCAVFYGVGLPLSKSITLWLPAQPDSEPGMHVAWVHVINAVPLPSTTGTQQACSKSIQNNRITAGYNTIHGAHTRLHSISLQV